MHNITVNVHLKLSTYVHVVLSRFTEVFRYLEWHGSNGCISCGIVIISMLIIFSGYESVLCIYHNIITKDNPAFKTMIKDKRSSNGRWEVVCS